MSELIIFTTNRFQNRENDLFKCENSISDGSRCNKCGIGQNLSQFWKGENRTLHEWDYTIRRIRNTNVFAYHNLEGHPRQPRIDFIKSLFKDIMEILKDEDEFVDFKRVFFILHGGDIGRRDVEFGIIEANDDFKQNLVNALTINCEVQIIIFKHGVGNPVANLLHTFPLESHKNGTVENYIIERVFKIPILLKDLYKYFETLKIQLALKISDRKAVYARAREGVTEILDKAQIEILPNLDELEFQLTDEGVGDAFFKKLVTKLNINTKIYL